MNYEGQKRGGIDTRGKVKQTTGKQRNNRTQTCNKKAPASKQRNKQLDIKTEDVFVLT